MKPTIYIINQFANTPDLPGHTRQFEIAKFLCHQGWNVNVYASDFNLSKRSFTKLRNNEFLKKELINKINWIWLRVFPYKKNNWKRYINIFSFCIIILIILPISIFFKKIKGEKKGIILASSPQLPAAFLSFLLAKIFNMKFVLEVRDLWPQIFIDKENYSKNNFFIIFLQKIESILYTKSDYIIVLAKGVVDYVKNKGARNVAWLPNGPSLNEFKYHPLPKENKVFDTERPFRIIYSGTHGEVNDLENVIKAAKILRILPIQFIFIGDGPKKNSLMKESKALGNVIFLNPVSKFEIPSYIASADAVLVSLKDLKLFKYGVSPNKLYDAYAIGRPIISSIGGCINNEIIKYKIGVCADPGSPGELSKAIKKLFLTSRLERENMSRRARLLSEKLYSREKINIKYNNLLKEILNSKNKRS